MTKTQIGMLMLAVGVLSLSGLSGGAAPRALEQERDVQSLGPYDPNVPRPDAVLGHAIGERHTYHHQMETYIQALARSSPRVNVVPYGRSYEGRTTYLVIVSSEDNIKRLDAIRTAVARLKDPRQTSDADMRTIASSTPAIVWLNYANDGNESAAFEAGLQMAYQLAASEHPDMRRIREQLVTVLNPSHNPDSHERFVTWFDAVIHGEHGTPDRAAAEHTGDWLMDANDNHYRFDLNRDAIGLTQKETREIVAAIHRWNPQVFIDHHGNPPIFFFPPTASPTNANFPESTAYWDEVIGKAIAAEFGKYGWSFMNRETYETIAVNRDRVAENANFLKDNEECSVLTYGEEAISVELPAAVVLEVTDTDPWIKGDTAQGGTKPAKLETGLTVSVPLFVNNGDKVKVDTRSGEYLERA